MRRRGVPSPLDRMNNKAIELKLQGCIAYSKDKFILKEPNAELSYQNQQPIINLFSPTQSKLTKRIWLRTAVSNQDLHTCLQDNKVKCKHPRPKFRREISMA